MSKKEEIKYETKMQTLIKLKEKLAFERLKKVKKNVEGQIGKETYQFIDKLIQRNLSGANQTKQTLLKEEEDIESTARLQKDK